MQDSTLTLSDRKLLELVETRISPNDGMYIGNGAHYYRVGLSAINCIEQALIAAGINTVRNVLDLPCGHGRVLRFLVHRFPEARFIACDLDRDGVEFCAEHLGAEAEYSEPDLSRLALGREFDLIWCGSLVTHLDDKKIPALLEFFSRHLTIGGLMIFTAPGDEVLERMTSGKFDYGIDPQDIPIVVGSYRETGFGYTDYPYMAEYGISLTSSEWIRNQVEKVGSLREVYYQPHGWDNHQDVYGFVREW
ncbi:MAG: class I SAM-dependent methyltransferase [Pyrinomonadaceae bacterium]